MVSEVAQLKERIRLEAESMYQAMHGYAEVTKHEIIHQKYQSMGEICDELKQHIGEEATTRYVIQVLDRTGEQGPTSTTSEGGVQ